MIKGVHHVAVNVVDMDTCVRFYEDVLGLTKFADLEMTGNFLDTVQGRKDMGYRIVKLKSPDGLFVELLYDFRHNEVREENNYLQKPGVRHFAYEVEDVDRAYEIVKNAGCETVSEPCTCEDGSMRLFFVKDPEGNLIELMQFPN